MNKETYLNKAIAQDFVLGYGFVRQQNKKTVSEGQGADSIREKVRLGKKETGSEANVDEGKH